MSIVLSFILGYFILTIMKRENSNTRSNDSALQGSYIASGSVTDLRSPILDRMLPAPKDFEVTPAKAQQIQSAFPSIKARVSSAGFAAIKLDRELAPGEFLGFARLWGEPIREHDPDVSEFVDDDCILNIVSKWKATNDVARQPFSESEILLHTEGSRRPVREQPRFLLFMCIEQPRSLQGGQTILVPMADVAARLSSTTVKTLQQVRYSGGGMPPILRKELKHWVFSFRDFGPELLQWSASAFLTAGQVNSALDEFLRQLYERESTYGVRWQRNMILVLDNHRFFHGRTRLRARYGVECRRLQRIRVAGLLDTP